jgi:RHS repeat-associated protein
VDISKRGFTDHEHLDEQELIHMNGRVYDYNLGRFMSVDPFIQSPTNSQSINPYSYIMNNPLGGTDPTGYRACKATGSNIASECGSGDGHEDNSSTKVVNGGAKGNGAKITSESIVANWQETLDLNSPQQVASAATNSAEGAGGGDKAGRSSFTNKKNPNGRDIIQTDGTVYEPNADDGVTFVNGDGVPSFDPEHDDFHAYALANSCSKSSSGCNIENIRQGSMRYPAPGASGDPVTDEQVGVAKGLGLVRHEVSADGSVIINVTLAGTVTTYNPILQILTTRRRHLLAPGRVIRVVTEDTNRVYIHTYGDGTGFAGRLNNALKHQVWDPVDQQVFDWAARQ